MLKYTLMTNKPTTSILLLNESCTKLQLQSIRDVNQGLEFRLRIPKFDVLINCPVTSHTPSHCGVNKVSLETKHFGLGYKEKE